MSEPETGDGHKVVGGIVTELSIEIGIDERRHVGREQRISIRLRLGHVARANLRTGAALVLDDDRSTPGDGKALPNRARDHVGRTSGWIGNHECDRS